jgi:Ran GTPase-activating protein (RanGAP) involved in mRNA processing and transport
MCKQVVADRHIGSLVDSIRHNENVRHFLIGNNIVGDAGASRISQLLSDEKTVPALQTMYLAGNCIGEDGVAHLADALRVNRTVKSLWLKRNPVHVDGVRHLASLLEENQTLEALDLVNTGLLDEGVKVLFSSLRRNTTLRTLYLDANGITPAGAHHIADYFTFLKTEGIKGLTGIFLAVNRLGDEGARIIAEGVRGYPHLVRLDLSSNRIQVPGLKTVLEVAETLPALRFLGLGLYKSTTDLGELPNYFDGEGADCMAEFLRTNQTIQVLDLRDVNLRPGGFEMIVDALESNTTLLHLYSDQSGMSFPEEQRKRLEAILARNVSAAFGMDLETFRSNPLRFIKHTEDIRYIDSIYRNRM